jgi:hypothetical protein
MRPIHLVGVVSLVAAGFALRTVTETQAPRPSASVVDPTVLRAGPERHMFIEGQRATVRADTLRNEVRAAIREEFASQRGTRDTERADQDDELAERPLSAEAIRAIEGARSSVDEAISQGVWTQDDTQAFRARIAAAPGQEAFKVRLLVVQAINKDQLKVARGAELP